MNSHQILSRRVAVILSLAIWSLCVVLALRTTLAQVWVIGIAALGLAPYLVSLHFVEPWIAKRERGSS
jgi:hypothetical protein